LYVNSVEAFFEDGRLHSGERVEVADLSNML
jgi:hypothetical protein